MKITDALLGIFFALLGAAMFWQASQFPSFAGQPYGAAFLPELIASAFMIGGVLLVIRDVQTRRLNRAEIGEDHTPIFAWTQDLREGGLPALIAVLGNVLAQILLSTKLGFIPVSIVGLTVLFLVLRLRPWVAVVLAIATSFACWWLFVGLLRVPLPRGLLDGVL